MFLGLCLWQSGVLLYTRSVRSKLLYCILIQWCWWAMFVNYCSCHADGMPIVMPDSDRGNTTKCPSQMMILNRASIRWYSLDLVGIWLIVTVALIFSTSVVSAQHFGQKVWFVIRNTSELKQETLSTLLCHDLAAVCFIVQMALL